MAKIAQILVAAGIGARAGGDIPKQYRLIGGKPLLRRTHDALSKALDPAVSIIVIAKNDPYFTAAMQNTAYDFKTVTGGATRTDSVKAGLIALKTDVPDYVFIHDAARPFVTPVLINPLLAALDTHPAAVPALPITDACKTMDGQAIDRSTIRRVQTPQAFHYTDILTAFERLNPGQSFADDIAIAYDAGLPIKFTAGDADNFKVTYPEDFAKVENMTTGTTYIATGSGYDVHRYTDGDGIWLCGIKIDAPYRLLGHSDADAPMHALTDAIFGALAEGDIGDHFPPSDPQWKGAASDIFLKEAVNRIAIRGGRLHHVDLTLICEKPKIKPHREAMRARLSEILGLSLSRISVKATTSEKLGFTGREEGLAAHAIATIELPE